MCKAFNLNRIEPFYHFALVESGEDACLTADVLLEYRKKVDGSIVSCSPTPHSCSQANLFPAGGFWGFCRFSFLLGWIPFRHFLGHGLGCPVDGCHHLFQDISFLSLGVYVFSYCQLSLIVLMQVLEEKVEKTWGGSVTFICSFHENFLVWLSILVLTSLGAAILFRLLQFLISKEGN